MKIITILLIAIMLFLTYNDGKNRILFSSGYVNLNIKEDNNDFFKPYLPDYTDENCKFHEKNHEIRKKTAGNIYNDITLNKFKSNYLDKNLLDGYSYNNPQPVSVTTRNISLLTDQLNNKLSWVIPNFPGEEYSGDSFDNAKYMFGTNYHIMRLSVSFCHEFKTIEEFKDFFSTVNNLNYILLYYSKTQTNYISIPVMFTEGSINEISDVVKKLKEHNKIRNIIFEKIPLPKYLGTTLLQEFIDRPLH